MRQVKLEPSVRLVVVQFDYSNPEITPGGLKKFAVKETPRGNGSTVSGVEVLARTEKVAVTSNFFSHLETKGYQLVEAGYKEAVKNGHPYHSLRVIFAQNCYAAPSEEVKKDRGEILMEVSEFCGHAMWTVKGYRNPFLENGAAVSNQSVLSLVCFGREPLFENDGTVRRVWSRDAQGNQLRNVPKVPILPNYELRLNGQGEIYLDGI